MSLRLGVLPVAAMLLLFGVLIAACSSDDDDSGNDGDGAEPEKTWQTPVNTYDDAPAGTLDYIYVSPEFKISEAGLAFDQPSAENADLYPSDHLGLYAVLELDG